MTNREMGPKEPEINPENNISEHKKMSRRGFLKGLAAGAVGAGLVVAGYNELEKSEKKNDKKPEIEEPKIEKLETIEEEIKVLLKELETKAEEFKKIGWKALSKSMGKGADKIANAKTNFENLENFNSEISKKIRFIKYRMENNYHKHKDEEGLFSIVPEPCTPDQLFGVIKDIIKTVDENIKNFKQIDNALNEPT